MAKDRVLPSSILHLPSSLSNAGAATFSRMAHPRRRGFILLFGTRPIISDDPASAPVNAVCPRCGLRADIAGKSVRHWFTLFFIPVFPVSGSRRFSQCTHCGAQFPVEARQLGTQVAAAERQQSQRAIALYNSLRNSPANSITLNELMTLYASMNEFDQAISAARDFPQALQLRARLAVQLPTFRTGVPGKGCAGMHVQDLKRWHWVVIALVVGVALSYVWSSVEWDENLPTIGQRDFEAGLTIKFPQAGHLENVTVMPPEEGKYKVVAEQVRNTKTAGVVDLRPVAYMADTPYKA